MNNPKKNCFLVTFFPVESMPENEACFLDEYFDVVAVNYTDEGEEEYVGYISPCFNEDEFLKIIKEKNLKLPKFTVSVLEDKNWLKENVIKFASYEIGEFMIYGIHETSVPETSKIPVQVYAATAFGSEHQTTKMCLTGISDLYRIIDVPHKILDMGTGSGILSIAAAKIWAKKPRIWAADIDPESVEVTHSNAITNGVDDIILSIESNGYENEIIKNEAPFDLIFANILANPLKEMSINAYSSLKKNGYYLISGFIDSQQQDIIDHHKALGFQVFEVYQIENWFAVLLKK